MIKHKLLIMAVSHATPDCEVAQEQHSEQHAASGQQYPSCFWCGGEMQ